MSSQTAFGNNKKYDIQFFWRRLDNNSVTPNFKFIADPTKEQKERLSLEDKQKIADYWVENHKPWTSYTLGTLIKANHSGAIWAPTEYAIYRAAADPTDLSLKLDPSLYREHRVSSVGIAIYTHQGVIVQRRPKGLTAGGLFDSGVAGFAIVKDENHLDVPSNLFTLASGVAPHKAINLDFYRTILDKIAFELYSATKDNVKEIVQGLEGSIQKGDLTLTITGVFSGGACMSGMVSARLNISPSLEELTFDKIRERLRQKDPTMKRTGELTVINPKDLPSFVHNKFLEDDLVEDGASTFLASLPIDTFRETINGINQDGRKKVQVGSYFERVFLQQPYSDWVKTLTN